MLTRRRVVGAESERFEADRMECRGVENSVIGMINEDELPSMNWKELVARKKMKTGLASLQSGRTEMKAA